MISILLRVTKFGLLLIALVLVAALRLAFMVCWTLWDTLAFLLLLSLFLPSLLIMFIPSTFKRPVSSWKALRSEERRVGKECRSGRWPELWKQDETIVDEQPLMHGFTKDRDPYPCQSRRRLEPGRTRTEHPRRAMTPRTRLCSEPFYPPMSFFFQAEDGIRDRSRHSC